MKKAEKSNQYLNKKIHVGTFSKHTIYILNGKIFCDDKEITIAEAKRIESQPKSYQAYMDYARGSRTPEEAYISRGFVKKKGKWELPSYTIDQYLKYINKF